MKSLRLNGQLLITAILVTLLSLIGGCAPKVLVPPDLPPEQQAAVLRPLVVFLRVPIFFAVDGEYALFCKCSVYSPRHAHG